MESQYKSINTEVESGKAPGLKIKLLSEVGGVKTYVLVFSKGDEVVSGLTDFASEYDIQSAHYQGIGSAFETELGWFDFDRQEYLVNTMGVAEVTSIIGNITWFGGKAAAHSHTTVSLGDGSVRGGHLLKMAVGATIEIVLTAEPTFLYKTLNPEFKAATIDPEL
ncbi:PPC domain-containing DNA-binding protein [Flavobacterium qiangtangense]|uniref:PPC domain-containing DNA-binding protein n=1 Tax=Flavobacterium qiangtangense TaxID=1442595 RepID=A0ABW1PKY8_9FLAO